MKKIEKMTYTEIINYCKKLKLEARYRIAQQTLDFFKQNVNKPMTFKELIAIGLKNFEGPQSFGAFVSNYLDEAINKTTKVSYAIACDESGKPLDNAIPFEHGELVAYYLADDDEYEEGIATRDLMCDYAGCDDDDEYDEDDDE